jgi:hypothetical protein
MSNIKKLENFISSYRTYDQVKEKAKEIDENWRESSWSRALRKSSHIIAVQKDNKRNSPIIGYRPKNLSQSNFEPNKKRCSSIKEELNQEIVELLENTKADWNNLAKVQELNKALKSQSGYVKKTMIEKYK